MLIDLFTSVHSRQGAKMNGRRCFPLSSPRKRRGVQRPFRRPAGRPALPPPLRLSLTDKVRRGPGTPYGNRAGGLGV
jgi:hypothetical protein